MSDPAEALTDAVATQPAPNLHEIELAFPSGLTPNWNLLVKAGLPPIVGGGRRPRPIRVIWHDTPTSDLAKHDRILAEQDGTWRLIALNPGKQTWLLATAAPVLAESPDLPCLNLDLSHPPVPAGSFAGHTRTLEFGTGDNRLTIRFTTGHIHAVVDEAPISRVLLIGPEAPLALAAFALADQGATVPLASLAAETLALAEHKKPSARHKGAAQMPEDLPTGQSLAVAIGQLVDTTLHWLAQIPDAKDSEPVHQMRVAVRRLRSLLGTPRKETTGPLWQSTRTMLRDWARELGDARAWDVFLETIADELAHLKPDDKRVAQLLARARNAREKSYAKLRTDLASASTRRKSIELALFATLRPFEGEGDPDLWKMSAKDFAVTALDRRLHKLRAPGEDLTILSPPDLHEIRKKAKQLRYTCELAGGCWGGKQVKKYADKLSELQDTLGIINDTATLEPQLAAIGLTGYAAGLAVGLAMQRAAPKLSEAQKLWEKLDQAEEFWK